VTRTLAEGSSGMAERVVGGVSCFLFAIVDRERPSVNMCDKKQACSSRRLRGLDAGSIAPVERTLLYRIFH